MLSPRAPPWVVAPLGLAAVCTLLLVAVPPSPASNSKAPGSHCQLILAQIACFATECEYTAQEVETGVRDFTYRDLKFRTNGGPLFSRVVMHESDIYCAWQVCTEYPNQQSCGRPVVRWDRLKDGIIPQGSWCVQRDLLRRPLPICGAADAMPA